MWKRTLVTMVCVAAAVALAVPAAAVRTQAAIGKADASGWLGSDAETARKLVHAATYGTVSTINATNGYAMGSVLSVSDGAVDKSTGRLLFYITPMDLASQNIAKDPQCTFTISRAQVSPHECALLDPENPLCSQISLSGKMAEVPAAAQAEAREMIFARHPTMALWPKNHEFSCWELKIDTIRLLSQFGGAHFVPVDTYFSAKV